MPAGFHPLHCILPPEILKNMLANGSSDVQQAASYSINLSAILRAQRQAFVVPVAALLGAAAVGKSRTIYSADGGGNLPGRAVRQEGQPATGDPATDEAYDGAGATYDFYWNIFERNSVDGNGLHLTSTVHYQKNFDNAFWNGDQMVYGDGDGQVFNRFTLALDVIGHELTHGVTQYSSNLNYSDQPGALNESISDIFGSMVKQYHLSQTSAQADWLIGAGLFTPSVKGVALRSMKAPGTAYNDPIIGKDPQPADMSHYLVTTEDNGGVHTNSGIPNHAFYLMATELGGYSWEKAGRIWYTAQLNKFTATTNFQDAANLTYQVAGEIYGPGSLEQQAVGHGWSGVGITVGAPGSQPQPQGQSTGCLAAAFGLLRGLFGGN